MFQTANTSFIIDVFRLISDWGFQNRKGGTQRWYKSTTLI